MSSRSKWLLAALCGWTVFVWGTRISNAWSSSTETTSAKVVSTVLAVSFVVFAAGGVVVLVRSWARPVTQAGSTFLVVFAGWTVVVWCVRIVGILLDGHGVAFEAVHVVLGVISMTLAIAAARSVRAGAPSDTVLSTVG